MKEKTPFYEPRLFGNKFTDAFGFFGQNFVQILKYFSILVLPFIVISEFLSLGYRVQIAKEISSINFEGILSIFVDNIPYMLLSIIVTLSTLTLAYTLLKVNNDRKEGLRNLEWSEFVSTYLFCLKKVVIANLLAIVFCAFGGGVIGLLMVVLSLFGKSMIFFYFILYIGLLIVLLPLYMFLPTYIFEDKSPGDAVKKAWRIGWASWGSTFGLMLVVCLLLGFAYWVIDRGLNLVFGFNNDYVLALAMLSGDIMFTIKTILVAIVSAFITFIVVFAHSFQYADAAVNDDEDPIEETVVDEFDDMANEPVAEDSDANQSIESFDKA